MVNATVLWVVVVDFSSCAPPSNCLFSPQKLEVEEITECHQSVSIQSDLAFYFLKEKSLLSYF